MKATLTARGVTFGEGRCKICAPMVGRTPEALLAELCDFRKVPFDIVEWRVDHFGDVIDPAKVKETLQLLRREISEIPMIFTFRTRAEGGNDIAFSREQYVALTAEIAATGLADFVDIELATGKDAVNTVVQAAHSAKRHVILSHHNFERTYPKEEIIAKLEEMLEYDADVSKIALMPQSKTDVLTLQAASVEMYEAHPQRLMIAISMGGLGIMSRINAELTGSMLTFGAASGASAPGQINTVDLAAALDIIHKTNS